MPAVKPDIGGGNHRRRSVNIQPAKKKLNELFITWMTLPETQDLVAGFVREYEPDYHPGRAVGDDGSVSPKTSSPRTQLYSPPRSPKTKSETATNPATVVPKYRVVADELDRGLNVSPPTSPKPPSPGGLGQANSHFPNGPVHGSPPLQGPNNQAMSLVNQFVSDKLQTGSWNDTPADSHTAQPQTASEAKGKTAASSTATTASSSTTSPAINSLRQTTETYNKQAVQTPTSKQDSHLFRPATGRSISPPEAHPPSADKIPLFHFPTGKPISKEDTEKENKLMQTTFRGAPKRSGAAKSTSQKMTKTFKNGSPEWLDICEKICGFPRWFSNRVFTHITARPGNTMATEMTYKMFKDWWDNEMAGLSKEKRLFNFIKRDNTRDHLVKTDFIPFIQDLLLVHPGLEFLKQTPEFQEKYAETVGVRVFYVNNRKGNGKMELAEFVKGNLVSTLYLLDTEEDINSITDFFSYEHFYVLYCKFWELDRDHDFMINAEDLCLYQNFSLTNSIVDVIFKGIPRSLMCDKEGYMNYEDFIWFCLSEEDKTTDTALEYWFRAIDLDRDGIISGYELDDFYVEQKKRMEGVVTEQISFDDILCQMIDMIKPKDPRYIRLHDIKACPTSGVFFNVLFNLNKFIAFEHRDPFQAAAEKQGPEKTDWDRFARLEYDRMAAEADNGEDMGDPEMNDAWHPMAG